MDAHQLKRIATNISADNAIEVWIAGMHIHESLVNRGGLLRLDYVFENVERVRCQLHPGRKSKDAAPIFTQL